MKLPSSMAATARDGFDGGKDDRKRGWELSDDEEQVDQTSSSEDEDDDDDYDGEDELETDPAALKEKSNVANSKGGRGLSHNYIGKSKSSYEKLDALDIKASEDVGNPLNKKRRLHISAATSSLSGSNEDSASMASARAAASVQTTESSASMLLPTAVKKKRRGVTKKVVWSKITLVREQNNESRSRNQNRLTRLGKNVIAWKRVSKEKKWRMTPDLKPHRMDRLKNAKVLRIRNQRDIEAVVYLIKHCCFNNKIQVPDICMLKHMKKRLRVFLKKFKFTIRACESDDESYRASDRENDSADRYDSDACVREVQDEESSAPPEDFDVDIDYDTYLEKEVENEDGSESDTYDYGNDTDESGSD